LRNALVIAGKEFRSYLTSPMAYIVIAIFIAATGLFFGSADLSPLTYSETSIRGFLQIASLLILLFAAIITMRLIAEEKKLGTIELLFTAPVKDSEIILGKFLGSMGIMIVMLLLTAYFPILLVIFGDPDIGPILSGYLGLFLLSCAALSVGIFTSAITSNQIVAAVIAGGILFALWFMGSAASYLPAGLENVIGFFSLSSYFPDFMRGVIDTRGIVFYISVAALFIFLAIRSLENSRWS